ncbi:MAG: transcriptional repressor LexA [Candidatus Rokuibacteriota bacterium]
MRELTDRQQEVLKFISSFSAQHGMPPTVREIGQRFRVTPRAAFDHLRALERKGVLKRRATSGRTSRALTLAHPQTTGEFRRVPVLGRIAAGAPLLAEEHRDGELPFAPSALPGPAEDFFALRVRGDSMIGAHICDGDLVVVRRQSAAQPNDIVVALLGDGAEAEATVKRFVPEGPRVVLKSENPTMGPIVVDPRSRAFKILGKVIGVVRGF